MTTILTSTGKLQEVSTEDGPMTTAAGSLQYGTAPTVYPDAEPIPDADTSRVLVGNGLQEVGGGVPAWLTSLNPDARWGIETITGGRTYRTALSCVRASSGYGLAADGTLTGFGNDEARITDLGLMVEPAVTNNLLWSTDFTFAGWGHAGCDATADGITAPDGETTADLVTVDTSTGVHRLAMATGEGPGQYCASVFIKQHNGSRYFGLKAGIAGADQPVFDLLTGTVAQGTGTIEAFGDGWYRIGHIFTIGDGDQHLAYWTLLDTPDFSQESFTGDGELSFWLWGGQSEQGTEPTSPIVTEATTVARAADAISLAMPAGSYDATIVFDDDSTQTIAGVSNGWTLPTDLDRRVVKAIYGVRT